MPETVIPLPDVPVVYNSIAEMFQDPNHDEQKKLEFIWLVKKFETLNGITKADLHAMLKWLAEYALEEEVEEEGNKGGTVISFADRRR